MDAVRNRLIKFLEGNHGRTIFTSNKKQMLSNAAENPAINSTNVYQSFPTITPATHQEQVRKYLDPQYVP